MNVIVRAVKSANVEWELTARRVRTGRWRRRQFYALPGVLHDKRIPSERTACEWRDGTPR